MTAPNDTILNQMVSDVADLGFATGTAGQNLAAMSVAWELAEYGIGTDLLVTGTSCEHHNFPTGWVDHNQPFRMIQLHKTRLSSIVSVTVHHELHDCECGVEEISGCATIYNELRSEVAVERCASGNCICQTTRPHPFAVEVCYLAGLFPTTADINPTVKAALGLLFSWWFNLLQTGGGEASSGFVNSWRSMDYSESYGFIGKNLIGTSPQAAAAWALLRKYRIMRAIGMRSYYPSQLRGAG